MKQSPLAVPFYVAMLTKSVDRLIDEVDANPAAFCERQSIIARELVARAVEIDGGDNTTAQVIRARSVEQVGMYRGRPYRLPSA